MEKTIKELLLDSAKLKTDIANNEALLTQIAKATTQLINTVKQNGTIYACGNGGSACDALHLVEELVAKYKRERIGIKAMHFADYGTITCWSNDYDFDSVYKRCVETFCNDKDLLVLFSTSGNSKNIIQAAEAAKEKNCFILGLAGKSGGQLAEICDLTIVVPHNDTERIQEAHITFVHILLECMERELFES